MFDENTGTVLFPDSGAASVASRSSGGLRMSTATRTSTVGTDGRGRPTNSGESLPDACLNVYARSPVRSITAAETLSEESKSSPAAAKEEHFLWRLVADLLKESEKAPQYNPDAIGIATTSPARQWFISQHAHIQDLVLRCVTLRRSCVVLRWLESTYRSAHSVSSWARRMPGPVTSEPDAVLLRRIVLSHLRGGDLHLALQTAEGAQDGLYCCILAASELQTVQESWYNRTALAPLFGEYERGEVGPEVPYACNDHRLTNLSYLFEDSQSGKKTTTVQQLDATIAAVLSGNHSAIDVPLFSHDGCPPWQHELWGLLRSQMITAFNKALVMAGNADPSMRYVQHLNGMWGTSARSWVDAMCQDVTRQVSSLLTPLLSPQSTLSVEEQLEVRVILQFFALSHPSGATLASPVILDGLFDRLSAHASSLDARARNEKEANAVRLITHLLLCLDLANGEKLVRLSIQGPALVEAVQRHLVVFDRSDWQPQLPAIIGVVKRLTSPAARADAFATFVFALRVGSLSRGVRPQSVEQQETSLLKILRREDACEEVHSRLQVVLQHMASEAPLQHLLTSDCRSEALLFESMNVDHPSQAWQVLRHANTLCIELWQTNATGALHEVMDITRNHLLPKLMKEPSASSSPLPDTAVCTDDLEQLNFWNAVLRVLDDSVEHMALTATLKTVVERSSAFQMQQREDQLRRSLMQSIQEVLQFASGLVQVHPDASGTTAGCCAWAVRSYTEAVTLALPLRHITDECAHGMLQQLFGLVETFDHSNAKLMERGVLHRADAEALFNGVRTARAAFGLRRFQRNAERTLASVNTQV